MTEPTEPVSRSKLKVGDKVVILKDVRSEADAAGQTGTYQGEVAVGITLYWMGKPMGNMTIAGYDDPATKTNEGVPINLEYPFYPDAVSVPRPLPIRFAFPSMAPKIALDGTGEIITGDMCWWDIVLPGENAQKNFWLGRSVLELREQFRAKVQVLENELEAAMLDLEARAEAMFAAEPPAAEPDPNAEPVDPVAVDNMLKALEDNSDFRENMAPAVDVEVKEVTDAPTA
jgi:hypothetical protein